MNIRFCLTGLTLIMMSCTTQEPPKILEVGGNQLPAESASSQLTKESADTKADTDTPVTTMPTSEPPDAPVTQYNLQTPYGPGLDALPTLVIPSPSGNKVVILPPPSR